MSLLAKAAAGLLVVSLWGCSTWLPSPNATGKPPYTLEPPGPTLTAMATVAPTGHGRPYSAADVARMLEANAAARPAGFARELRAPAVMEVMAGVLADEIYTFDGRPYQRVVFSASCDQAGVQCDLTMAGVPAFTDDPEVFDSYGWTVAPRVPLVTLTSHALRGFPPDLTADLDDLARSLDADNQYRDRPLLGVEWELPPPDDAWVLRYGNGLEEGDPTFLVTIDRVARRLLAIRVLP